jgi:hypothetical protein
MVENLQWKNKYGFNNCCMFFWGKILQKIVTSLSPIRRGFAPGFVNYKKGCTRLAAASDKVYQLFAHGRWFSPGSPASSTTKTCRHDTPVLRVLRFQNRYAKYMEA